MSLTFTNVTLTSGQVALNISGLPFGPTTWNPADKAVLIDLSNGNLTAEITDEPESNTRKGVRSVFSTSSGKYYWEVTTNIDFSNPGMATAAWALDSGNTVELNDGFLGINSGGNGIVSISGTTDSGFNAGTTGGGATVSIALDLDNAKMWLSSTGTWPSGGDPATGAFPFFSTIPANTYHAAWVAQALVTLGKTTTNFGDTAFTGVGVPAGFMAGLGS